MKYNCLIIDDEKMLADSTAEYFNIFGVSCAAVYSAEECKTFLSAHTAELILLDINLGDQTGFELCRDLRRTTNIPILFISARTSDDDQIIALNIGGDDYIQKPYSLGVLLAKVKAVLKRYHNESEKEYRTDGLRVNFETQQVFVADEEIKLTALEFRLLAYLIEHKNKVISKQELFEKVWKDKFTGDGTLNVHIRKLREGIEKNPNAPEHILTIWGYGYKFVGDKNEKDFI